MPHDIMPVRGVTKNYGVRDLGVGASRDKTINNDQRFLFVITPTLLQDIAAGNYVPNIAIPEGHVVKSSRLVVREAFDLDTPAGDLVIGTGGNTITIADSVLESTTGSGTITPAGGLADDALILTAVELGATYGGADVLDTTVGSATLVIETVTAQF